MTVQEEKAGPPHGPPRAPPRGPRRRLRLGLRLATWIALAVLLGYVGIILGPYLRSTLVRDAAVTTWIHLATAPIYGEVASKLPRPGDRIGAAGQIAEIVDEKADKSLLETALAQVAREEEVYDSAVQLVEALQGLRAERIGEYETYRAVILREIDARLSGVTNTLAKAREEQVLLDRIAGRKERLAETGSGALSDFDEARAQVAALERQIESLIAEEAVLAARRQALDAGAILLQDGNDPEWGSRALDDLDRALAEAVFARQEAEADLTATLITAEAEEEAYLQRQSGFVRAPENAMLWSTIVGEGAAVDIGAPVATWIDCTQLLIDVPLSDAMIALLHQGAPATVILEGETRVRSGSVLLTRGSAATIRGDDLAALAKGRSEGVAQVLLTLEADQQDFAACPVGQAAYVDFPEIGILDVLRVRLRL